MKTSQSMVCLVVVACLMMSLSLLVMTATKEKVIVNEVKEKIETTPQDINYGTVKGKFVFVGDIPLQKVLVKKGDAAAKDPHVSAVHGVLDESLVIDPNTRGVENIVIYIKKIDKESIHPSLVESPQKEVLFTIEHARYKPHILFVRTSQTVTIANKDDCYHNFHSIPIKNISHSFSIYPKTPHGAVIPEANISESLPIPVQCDIHPWMKAHWMILDHPYCAITKADGSFEIPLIPKGKYQFRVWHEKKGYLNVNTRVGFNAKIGDRTTFDIGTIELTMDQFR